VPLLIRFFAETEGLLPIALVWNDRLCASLFQRLPQFGAVVGFVGEEFLGLFGLVDQRFGNRTVMRLAARQDEGKKTSLSICNCMDFRVAAASAPTNRLILLPPFPPEAERCALM
jgi:hypothetical protein